MRRLLALLAFVFAVPLAAQPATVAALAEAYENPTLGPRARVQNATIGISNMTIELTAGSAAPVMAGKEVIGLFFVGNGKYTYQSIDATEAPIVTFEARHASSAKVEKNQRGIALTDQFQELYLRVGALPIPELTGTGGAPLDTPFAHHREVFGKARVGSVSQLLIRRKLDRTSSPVAWAEFDGNGPSAYFLDSIESKSEGLYSLVRNRSMFAAERAARCCPSSSPSNRSGATARPSSSRHISSPISITR